MIRAPEVPSINELQQLYPLNKEAETTIAQNRSDYSHAIQMPTSHTLGIIGFCARPGRDKQDIIMHEGGQVAELSHLAADCYTAHRGPAWKPRTDPKDWHGEETTDPEGAYLTTRDEAEVYAHVAAEIGYDQHLIRYAHMLSFAWIGSRSIANTELIEAAAVHDPALPLGIKNGLDGDIELALGQVNAANKLRLEDDAPVTLIYRGGMNATSPKSWRNHYLEALELTEGKMIVDTAHGSEMAHDPSRNYAKTVSGQIMAMEAVIALAERGYKPAGMIMEASDIESRTDPHMPLAIALEGLKALHNLKTKVRV